MTRRKTTPLLVNFIDRVSQQQQLFLPIRTFGNSPTQLLLQSSQPRRFSSNSFFTCNLHSHGLGISALVQPDPKPTAEEPLSREEEGLLFSPSTLQQPQRVVSFLSSHNFYPKPPALTTEELLEVSLVSQQKPTVDTTEFGSAMDQNPNYQGFNGGWPGLNPTAPSFEFNATGGQTYQLPPAQPAPAPGTANNQPPSHKKKKRNRAERKANSEGEYLTPRQRRKAGREQQQGGPNQAPYNRPPSLSQQAPSQNPSLPPKPPPGLPPLAHGAPLHPPSEARPADAPSLESGGVPDPTPAYLARASFPPSPSPQPRSLLLVLDLNGTLLHRPSTRRSSSYIRRPHAEKFLAYCFDTFSVAIWSSARPDNVTKMCDTLLTAEQKQKVLAIWGRDKFGLTDKDYVKRVQVYKRLGTVWGDEGINPHGVWDQGNTVLIDDSAEKARSEPHNAVTIPEFLGDVRREEEWEREWGVLPAVHEYLNQLAMTQDVSGYIRQNPFKMEIV